MMEREQRTAAKQFVDKWNGRGSEKEDAHSFWFELLQNVLGVSNPTEQIRFEYPVQLKHTSFIDAVIPDTKVMIEQKSCDIDLNQAYVQSDGASLTPYQQAKRYSDELELSKKPRWIVVCNFQEFHIHDMEHPHDAPAILHLADLPKEYSRLRFLTDSRNENLKQEMEVSIHAGEIVGVLYDAILKQYRDSSADSALKSLNKLCVRLVFCLYAEDAGIFAKNQFHDYLMQFDPQRLRQALLDLFKVLDTKIEERDPYLTGDLQAFPYVNGGLFADESIEIPLLDETIRDLLLAKASDDFDWSKISPTIFGAVFESTLNPETRRSGGMHYTSIENIHKVIDPLFLDALKAEFAVIREIKQPNVRTRSLKEFQKKLASLTFLDPACGSGNFLTETYLSLRILENAVLEILNGDQIVLDLGDVIQVSIRQFYGIEINDFAVTVAKTALWIAESQMMKRTEDIVHRDMDFLPLKSYSNIVEGNALRLDWNTVIPKENLCYIMGNPPFIGYSLQSKGQKEDILSIYVDENGKPYKTAGKIDYVAGWYFKAALLMQNTSIRTAFVSTNSITQGEQVAGVWKPLYERFHVHIDFAHRTFRWDSEASIKAHVHCVILGFSTADSSEDKILFDEEGKRQVLTTISPYLINAPLVFVESRNKPICDVPCMTTGNRPADGGHLIIEGNEYEAFLQKEPKAEKYIKRLVGSEEFINGKQRYCLWLVGVSPAELVDMPEIMKRIDLCRQDRLNSPDAGRRKLASRPALFREIKQSDSDYILIPRHSSENRRYIPIGFLKPDSVAGDSTLIIPDATIYHFGILISSVHMAWMRTVCGRLKSDYRYSKDIVYNNFPWPDATEEQKTQIERAAQKILEVREKYPDCSLAKLYGENNFIFTDLVEAHQANDRAVMRAYGFAPEMTEPEIVAELMRRYQQLTAARR